MHDAAGPERENAGDHQRARKQADHRLTMAQYVMPVRLPHRKRQHDQRKDRQQMDRAPWPPEPKLVNEERGHGDRRHEDDPDPAHGAVRQRALWRGKLDDAQDEGTHGREGMSLDRRRGIEQWGK